jgi:hypothetical protein
MSKSFAKLQTGDVLWAPSSSVVMYWYCGEGKVGYLMVQPLALQEHVADMGSTTAEYVLDNFNAFAFAQPRCAHRPWITFGPSVRAILEGVVTPVQDTAWAKILLLTAPPPRGPWFYKFFLGGPSAPRP